MYKVLFLGGAKRVSMARHFMAAAKALGHDIELYSYEISARVPISIVAKVIIGLRWHDPKIYDHIYELCQKLGIRIIVPFVDGAVAVAAELMRRHPGEIFAPASAPEHCELMFDKVKAAQAFSAASLPIPATITAITPSPCAIAKPRHGSASQGIVAIDDADTLRQYLDDDQYLVQQRIDPREEYTVDCYASMTDGRPLAVVPRLRMEVSGGEVTRTSTVFAPDMVDLAKEAISRLGLRGAVTVQMLRDKRDGRVMIMEINPRLGGGAVCSIAAGVDLPKMILSEADGIKLEPVCYHPYTEIARYQQEVVFCNV